MVVVVAEAVAVVLKEHASGDSQACVAVICIEINLIFTLFIATVIMTTIVVIILGDPNPSCMLLLMPLLACL